MSKVINDYLSGKEIDITHSQKKLYVKNIYKSYMKSMDILKSVWQKRFQLRTVLQKSVT